MNKETNYLNNYLGLFFFNCGLSWTLIEPRTNHYVGVKIRTVEVKILRDFSFFFYDQLGISFSSKKGAENGEPNWL